MSEFKRFPRIISLFTDIPSSTPSPHSTYADIADQSLLQSEDHIENDVSLSISVLSINFSNIAQW
jgi:hypothetical protein